MNTKQNMTKSDNERQISSEEIKKRAKEIIEAARQNNEDGIDLDAYTLGDINEPEATMHSEADIPDELKESMDKVGIDIKENKSGIYLQTGNKHDLCVSNTPGVELLPIKEALKNMMEQMESSIYKNIYGKQYHMTKINIQLKPPFKKLPKDTLSMLEKVKKQSFLCNHVCL